MEGVDAAIRLAPPARVSAEHVMGKYIIPDKVLLEEEWAQERATVIDEKPLGHLTDQPASPINDGVRKCPTHPAATPRWLESGSRFRLAAGEGDPPAARAAGRYG
jgi:hypothetical protein